MDKERLAQQFVNRVSERQDHKNRQMQQNTLMKMSGQIQKPVCVADPLDESAKFEEDCGLYSKTYSMDELDAFERRNVEHYAQFEKEDSSTE